MKIEVFGSYLDPTADRLGDVDVIIELEPKHPETWAEDTRRYQPVYPHRDTTFEVVVAPDLTFASIFVDEAES